MWRLEDANQLPPAARDQIMKKLAAQQGGKTSAAKMPAAPAQAPSAPSEPKPSKYHNRKTPRVLENGAVIMFASNKEAERFDELLLLIKSGRIRCLRLQPTYTLSEAYINPETGKKVKTIVYTGDFSYERKTLKGWEKVCEDAKSRPTKTRVYVIKKKLMKEKYGIDIEEV